MHDETPSPIDLPAPPLAGPGLGWAAAVIATATAILLVANAVSLRDWVDDLPPSPAQTEASAFVNRWVTVTQTVAIDRPRAGLHGLWKAAEAARF